MTDKTVVYELPLNERTRLFLRIEALFHQAQQGLENPDYWDAQLILSAFVEILNQFDRADIRAECIQELEKINTAIAKLGASKGVDPRTFEAILSEIQATLQALKQFPSQTLLLLRDNAFLHSLRARFSTPGNACSFDIPALHYWLNKPTKERAADLTAWLSSLTPLYDGISLILRLLRDSSMPTAETATNGFFQKHFDQSNHCQLVRIIPRADLYPEMSGSKHRLNLRFMAVENSNERSEPVKDDVDFELTCSTL